MSSFSKQKDVVVINLGGTEIIKVDTKLNFNEHVNNIIIKASRKVNALSRVVPYVSLSKKKILMNSFFNSQFRYCILFECISYLGPKICDIVPFKLKQLTSLNAFEKSIKNWQPKNIPCRLYKQCVLL